MVLQYQLAFVDFFFFFKIRNFPLAVQELLAAYCGQMLSQGFANF